MTEDSCSELCLVLTHDRITLAVANERINPLVCSHPFLANYADRWKEELTRKPGVHFSFQGNTKNQKLVAGALPFVFQKNKADLCVLIKLIHCTHLNNWHPRNVKQRSEILGIPALTSIYCQCRHRTLMKHHLTLLRTGTHLAVGLCIFHERYLKNGAPYCL